jgi:uncharacterized membrane protein YjgN (DUF898 family)
MKKGKIVFVGSFADYFIKSVGLMALTAITFGLLLPYFIYWQAKYFADNLEIEMYM